MEWPSLKLNGFLDFHRESKHMIASEPIFHDVHGAPYKIGAVVRVVQFVDETGDSRFLGMTGTVKHFEYFCGCGQSYPDDPMIGVDFGGRVEEFWKEELELRVSEQFVVLLAGS